MSEKQCDHDPIQEELSDLQQYVAQLQRDCEACRQELAAVRAEREFFHLVADYTNDWEYWRDPDGRFRYVSPACERITGYRPAEFYADPGLLDRVLHPDDYTRLRAEQQLRRAYELQFRIITRDGTERWIGQVCQPVYNAAGEWFGQRASNRDITTHKQLEQDLLYQRRFLYQIINSTPAIIFARDRNGRFTLVNQMLADVYGTTVGDLIGKTDADMHLDPVELEQIRRQDLAVMDSGNDLIIPESRIADAAGRTRYITIVKRPLYADDGTAEQVLVVATDITERRLAELQLQRANAQLVRGNEYLRERNHDVTLLNHLADMLLGCMSIAEAYEVISAGAQQLFDGQPGALYVRREGSRSFDAVTCWGDVPPAELSIELQQCKALQSQRVSFYPAVPEAPCKHFDDSAITAVLCVPLLIQGKTLGVLHLRHYRSIDLQARQRWQQLGDALARQIAMALNNLTLREQLQQQAIRDSLTGLYNRRYLDATLPRELQRVVRQQQSIGVVMLDIDHFKHFNDTYGHDAGDTLLRAVGAFLSTNIRAEDIACRYGGEEFILVLPGASLDDTRQRAEAIRAGVQSLQIEHQGKILERVTVSLGVTVLSDCAHSADSLIRAADQALYQAKRSGRNCVIIAA